MKQKMTFTPKKKQNEIKIMVIICFVLGFLSLFIAYAVSSAIDNNNKPTNIINENISGENISVVEENNLENFDVVETEKEISNLIKTYIDSSVKNEKEILYALLTNDWATSLKTKLENNTQETENIKFITTSLNLSKNNLSPTEGFFDVSYILEYNEQNLQQNIKVFVVKENEIWKISKVQ